MNGIKVYHCTQSYKDCSIRVYWVFTTIFHKCLILLLILILQYPIRLALCLMLSMTHYAGITGEFLATTRVPIFSSQCIYRPSYAQKAKSKLSPIKNPCDMHSHNSLSNVAIHIPCVNIHRAGHYQLEMVFMCACLPWLQWVTHRMDLTAFSCFCSKIKRYT